jgi:transposase-like protein
VVCHGARDCARMRLEPELRGGLEPRAFAGLSVLHPETPDRGGDAGARILGIALCARRHDVNTNQVITWRRQLLAKQPLKRIIAPIAQDAITAQGRDRQAAFPTRPPSSYTQRNVLVFILTRDAAVSGGGQEPVRRHLRRLCRRDRAVSRFPLFIRDGRVGLLVVQSTEGA